MSYPLHHSDIHRFALQFLCKKICATHPPRKWFIVYTSCKSFHSSIIIIMHGSRWQLQLDSWCSVSTKTTVSRQQDCNFGSTSLNTLWQLTDRVNTLVMDLLHKSGLTRKLSKHLDVAITSIITKLLLRIIMSVAIASVIMIGVDSGYL